MTDGLPTSLGELQLGVQLAVGQRLRARRLSRLRQIIENASIMPVDREVADAYATLRATTGRQPTNEMC